MAASTPRERFDRAGFGCCPARHSDAGHFAGLPCPDARSSRSDSRYKEIAGFANATVHFTPKFDLQFGGRYSKNDQSARQTSRGALAGGTTDIQQLVRACVHLFGRTQVQTEFEYDSVCAGGERIRPGGPNVIAPNAPPSIPRTYSSDSVVSWEAGVKAQSDDHRFSIDAAAFTSPGKTSSFSRLLREQYSVWCEHQRIGREKRRLRADRDCAAGTRSRSVGERCVHQRPNLPRYACRVGGLRVINCRSRPN